MNTPVESRAVAKSPRILIVRLSALGDVIHTLPVLNALRSRYPQAMLAWAVEQRFEPLLRGHESLDALIAVPRGYLKCPQTIWCLWQQLRKFRFDLVIETQGLTKSAVIGWLSRARRRIGFRGQWGRELSPWLNTELVRPTSVHAVDRYLELLGPLGMERLAVSFRMPEQEHSSKAAARVLQQINVADRFAMMHPGAGWPSKIWPAERFAQVARHLGEAWQLTTLVFWSGDQERSRAARIVEGSAGYARLGPAVSLGVLASVARRARVFVSSDTGPLHLAAAAGTPCVGLYGPWPAEAHGPYGPQHIAVQKMVCHGTTRQRRHCSSKYMDAIDTASVCEACDRILSRESASIDRAVPDGSRVYVA